MRRAIITIINLETTPTYELLMEVFGREGVDWFSYHPTQGLFEYCLETEQGLS